MDSEGLCKVLSTVTMTEILLVLASYCYWLVFYEWVDFRSYTVGCVLGGAPRGLAACQISPNWTVMMRLRHFHGIQTFYSPQVMKINIEMQMHQRQDPIQLWTSCLLISWSPSSVLREWSRIATMGVQRGWGSTKAWNARESQGGTMP